MSDRLKDAVSTALTATHGSTTQAIEELLVPLVAKYAPVFDLYASLTKAKTAAGKDKDRYATIEAALGPLIKQAKADKELLAAAIKTLRVRQKVLQFISAHLGEVFTYQDWYIALTNILEEKGDLREIRFLVGKEHDFERDLGGTLDGDVIAKRRARKEQLEASATKNIKPDLDAALLFLASHGVIAYFAEDEGKVVLPDHLPV